MKKALFLAAALGALTFPALAQQSPSGTRSGGPAAVGNPGQIGGGVPGTQPNVVERRMMMKKRMSHHRKMKHRRHKKKMM